MDKAGSFRKKNGFTIIGNMVTRDKELSLKAKGLYGLIQSYITLDELTLSKTFLQKNCKEGDKAFESAWQELKNAGYLKQTMQPVGKSWNVEYELFDEPVDGPHTFYLKKDGELSSTSGCANVHMSSHEDDRYPQNGGNAIDRTPRYGSSAEGSSGKGGNKRISTTDNTIYNNNDPSIIPYTSEEIERVTELSEGDFEDQFELSTFKLFNESLSEMTTHIGTAIYANNKISTEMVINKINLCRELDIDHSLETFAKQTIKDFIQGISNKEVRNHKGYMKSCIWNSFSTYQTKMAGLFLRTYDGA